MLPTAIAYFGLMWALLEFTRFIVARYALRDVWIDVAFVAIFAPSSPWLQVRLARAQGEDARTRELLQSLEVVWHAADSEHRAAAAMRRLWQELGMPARAEPAPPATAGAAG